MRRLLMGVSLAVLTGSWALADSTMPPYTAEWGPRKGDWEATLGGSGGSTNEFNRNVFSIDGGISYYALKWLTLGLRQSFATDFGDDVEDQFAYATRAAIDFQAPLGRFQPYLGFSGGYQYGDGAKDDYIYGPEAGIKFFVNESTFLYAGGAYFLVGSQDWQDGNALYQFGFGVDF